MQVWFCDVVWSQGAPLHLPPRRAENSPDPQERLGRLSYFYSANRLPPSSTGVLSLPSCVHQSIRQGTGELGLQVDITIESFADAGTPRMQHMHWMLAVTSSWGSTLRYLYICYSHMYSEHVWYPLCCLQHVKPPRTETFFKKCILNKATYCEHIKSVLWCFHWLLLRF